MGPKIIIKETAFMHVKTLAGDVNKALVYSAADVSKAAR
jgi:hypothetical protein